MLASEVLRIKRAKGRPDCRADSYNAFFYVRPKKRNPQITSDKQLWAPQSRWASWMLDAIVLHFLGGRCCIVHHVMSGARRMTVLIHLPLQNACVREAGCEFLFPPLASGRSDFHRYQNPPCARLSVPLTGRYYPNVTLSTAARMADDEKLEVLRRLDQFRHWHSLDEKRYCLVCGKLITGRQIQVDGGTRGNGPLRLGCPTEKCNSITMDWVLPTTEVLVKIEKLIAEERKARELSPAALTTDNSTPVPSHKARDDFMSRVLKFALPFKRYS